MAKSAVLDRLGEAVRAARKARGLTQAQVAERVDVAVETVSRIESGDVNVTVDVLDRLARALQVSLPELFIGAPSVTRGRPRLAIARIVALLEALHDEQLADVHAGLRAFLRARPTRKRASTGDYGQATTRALRVAEDRSAAKTPKRRRSIGRPGS